MTTNRNQDSTITAEAPRLLCPDAQDIVIVGATGDLARRKLLPALYNLQRQGLLPQRGEIVGLARSDIGGDEGFRRIARGAIEEFSRTGLDESTWNRLESRLHFHRLNEDAYHYLVQLCGELERLIYLAVPPASMAEIAHNLAHYRLNRHARLIVEKPFGTDLESSRELNAALHEAFEEQQIYRIDHYLGKETVQNLLVFRFANALFERVWNRDAVDSIQITVAESIGIEGRGSFYEPVGALRDIVQNHVLQMLALLTMEPPAAYDAESIRDEKAKLLRSIRPIDPADVVRGQYGPGRIDGDEVPGYRDEEGVDPGSQTETFVALKLDIDNWRWAGVPVYVRTGKRLPTRATEVEVAFKNAPTRFDPSSSGYMLPNRMTHRIQPEERIILKFLTKVPGPNMEVQPVAMRFDYDDAFSLEPAEAYERLLHDVMRGDHTLFVREDAVDRAWAVVEPALKAPPPVYPYAAGTWGPPEADAIVGPGGWHLR